MATTRTAIRTEDDFGQLAGQAGNLANDDFTFQQDAPAGTAAPPGVAPAAAGAPPPAPAAAPTAASTGYAPGFSDFGNGLAKNESTGQVLPTNHPLYLELMKNVPPAGPAAAPTPPPASYDDPKSVAGNTAINTQAAAAQTYSATPGAPPTATTANQGAQDVWRNSLLQRATQGTTIDTNDPTFRGQADAFGAATERSRRNALSQSAEGNFAAGQGGSSGGMDVERRAINEGAAQAQGSFEADLAYSELQNRRKEVSDAIAGLGGMVTGDQARMLTQNLADIDAAIKRYGIDESTKLGNKDIDVRGQIGMGGLNLDAIKVGNQDSQFNKTLGFNIDDREAYWNNVAMGHL